MPPNAMNDLSKATILAFVIPFVGRVISSEAHAGKSVMSRAGSMFKVSVTRCFPLILEGFMPVEMTSPLCLPSGVAWVSLPHLMSSGAE